MINISLDTKAFEKAIAGLGRQFPKTLSHAMHRTAEEARERQRQELHLGFTIRSGQSAKFLEQQVQVTERATPQNLATTVALRGPGASMLAKHEKGGTLFPTTGDSFYLPTEELRPSRQSVVPRGMYPKALRLEPRRDPGGSLPALRRGKRRTFIIRTQHVRSASGIYQRFGPRRDEIRMIWAFRPKITLKPRLHFVDTVTRTWTERFPVNFAGMFDAAMRSSR